MAQATATKVGEPAPALELPDTEGDVARAADAGRGAGDRRRLDLQPLPLRARLARPAGRGRARLRARAGSASSPSTPTTPSATPRDSLEAMRERVARGGLAVSLPPRRKPGGGARLGRPGHPARLRPRRAICGCATRALRTPTTWTPRQNAAWLREALDDDARAASQVSRAETEPVGCSIKWKSESTVDADDRPPPPRPRSGLLGEPRARATTSSPRRSRSTSSSRSPRRASSRSTRAASRCPDDRSNLCVRAFEALHPADGLRFEIRSEIPLARGLGSSAAAIVAGLMAADHLFELGLERERDLRPRGRARGPPRQRRRGALRGLRGLPAAPTASSGPPRSGSTPRRASRACW